MQCSRVNPFLLLIPRWRSTPAHTGRRESSHGRRRWRQAHAVHGSGTQTHGWCRTTTTTHEWRRHDTTSRSSSHLTGSARSGLFLSRRRWGTFHGQADHVLPANQNETERALFRALFHYGTLTGTFGKTEFFAFTEHQIQVLVKGQKGPDNVATVVQRHPQTMIHIFE